MKDALKGKTLEERIDWVAGRLIVSIGRGSFRAELGLMIQVVEACAVGRFEEREREFKRDNRIRKAHAKNCNCGRPLAHAQELREKPR